MTIDPARYAALFRTESREQLQTINRALLALEAGMEAGDETGAAALAEVFRAVHTIKGMCATLGYHALAGFLHTVESTLEHLRSGDARPTPALLDALFTCADALEDALAWVTEGAAATPAMSHSLVALRAATEAEKTVLRAATEAENAVGVGVREGPASIEHAQRDPLVGPGRSARRGRRT